MAARPPLVWRKIDNCGMARCCQEIRASVIEASALKICDTRMIFVRLKRSARCPAGKDKATTGTAITNPTKPSAVAEWVRAYISHSTATASICRPMIERRLPAVQNRNPRKQNAAYGSGGRASGLRGGGAGGGWA